jgi:predicted ester cyclase
MMKGANQMREEMKKEFINAVKDGWESGNIDSWDRFYAQDCIFHKPPFPDTDALEKAKLSTRDSINAYSEIKMDIHDFIVEGSMTAWRSTWQATHTGQSASLPIPPTGKRVVLNSCLINRWEGDKIVEEWEYSDYLGLLQQLGVIPALG